MLVDREGVKWGSRNPLMSGAFGVRRRKTLTANGWIFSSQSPNERGVRCEGEEEHFRCELDINVSQSPNERGVRCESRAVSRTRR